MSLHGKFVIFLDFEENGILTAYHLPISLSIAMDEYHKFACILAIEAGSYLRQQALARASRRGQPRYDLELVIKENAAVCLF